MICPQCNEWKPLERSGVCASCAAAIRKAERKKAPAASDPIAKVSQKQSKMLNQYAKIRQKFLLNKWCAYHGKPCLPTDIHHAMGRVGFADDKEIPLLIDIRYFVPVCREAHRWIEEHPREAKEQGYSESRLTNTI
jgi:hypothetical protein